MIQVSVLYPGGEGTTFDWEYYLERHVPMVQQSLGSACKRIDLQRGLSGPAPGAPATYATMGHMTFDSVEEFQAAFSPHAEKIMGDVPNFTNVEPVIQISEVAR